MLSERKCPQTNLNKIICQRLSLEFDANRYQCERTKQTNTKIT